MAWRGLHLTQPARLSLADGQVVVDQDTGVVRLALEDIAWVVLDTQQTSLSGALLAACMEAGIAIIMSDDKHMPNGIALPFHRYFRQGEAARRQIEIGVPLAKRLWQAIVVRKIENQAATLYACKAEGVAPLKAMARLVGSGDPDNVEARAARHYWGSLFEDFRRDDDSDRRNKLLNYGYAVVRAAVARAIVAVGLLPALGLKHASVSNAFNLADDLMEPFRPFVDRLAHELGGEAEARDEALSVEDRRTMTGVLFQKAECGDETVSLLVASERSATSLVRAFEHNTAELLLLPTPLP